MKAVKLEEFKLTSSIARNLAENMWGRGGTSTHRTNRKGVFYFSCSGHGGYVVDANALTEAERAKIEQYAKPDHLSLAVQSRKDGKFVIAVRDPRVHQKSVSFYADEGPTKFEQYPIFFFEEDCAWALLEVMTDIRCPDHENWAIGRHGPGYTDQERQRTFKQWFPEKLGN